MGSVCRMSWIISTQRGPQISAFAGPLARDISPSGDINLAADQAISKEKAERVKVKEAGKHEWDEPWRQFLNAQKWAFGLANRKKSPHFLSTGFMGKMIIHSNWGWEQWGESWPNQKFVGGLVLQFCQLSTRWEIPIKHGHVSMGGFSSHAWVLKGRKVGHLGKKQATCFNLCQEGTIDSTVKIFQEILNASWTIFGAKRRKWSVRGVGYGHFHGRFSGLPA